MFYRGKLYYIEKEKKQRVSKGILLPTCTSQHISSSIHGYEDNTYDQKPNIPHDVQEIHNKMVDGESNMWEIYLQLKEIFEGTFVETVEIPNATRVVDKEKQVFPF
jgi:hypothetical protein